MSKRPVRHLSEEQKDIVARLVRKRGELGITTEAEFVRRFILNEFSDSTWRHLIKDDYTGRPDPHIESCKRILGQIEALQSAERRQKPIIKPFHKLDVFKAAFVAIEAAGERPDCKRLVIYLAQQGGGKSALCDQVILKYKGLKVVSLPSWHYSYFASCSDVCRACGDHGPWKSIKDVESAMIRCINGLCALRDTPLVIAVEEGDALGPDSLNMIKVILNETRAVVLLTALPGLFDQMRKKSWFQSAQVIRRAIAILDLDEHKIRPSDIKPFVADLNFNGAGAEAMKEIADAANRFGAFDMIEIVAGYIREDAGKKPVELETVKQAVATAEKMWRLHRDNPFAILPPQPARPRGRPRKVLVDA